MDDPAIITTAIVLTAVEEGLSRSTMVHRDRFFRLLSGHDDYTPEELAEQRFCWMVQIGNSTIIEVFAILAHALCVVLFRPHRFVFNFLATARPRRSESCSVSFLSTRCWSCAGSS